MGRFGESFRATGAGRFGAICVLALLAACSEKAPPAPPPSAASASTAEQEGPEAIYWFDDYEDGLVRAEFERKPVLLFFSADW